MADPDAECYFCGSPNASKRCTRCKGARYCSVDCQAKHWKVGHKEDCRAANNGITISKADYHSYLDSLPCLDDDEILAVFGYHTAATKDRYLVDLANSIGYPLPGPENAFFRPHEFLQALVAHGQDTQDNMTRMYGYEMPPDEHRDIINFVYDDAQSRLDVERFSPRPWMEVIGRLWFQARIAVACGVGAPEGTTNALAMGAHAPLALPEGVPATDSVLEQLQKLSLPLSEVLEKKGLSRDTTLTCSICHDTIAHDESRDSSPSVQILPMCDHMFHPGCIMDWLKRTASCPMCRKVIPETIPRPATIQELNMAARLKQHNESVKEIFRRPLSELQLASWSGGYDNTVSVLYQLSDELDFSGGGCSMDVSPSGKKLVVTSTSIGKIVFLSLETSAVTLTSSTGVGRGFPGGPQSVAYDPTDESESTVVAHVDDNIVKYRHRHHAARINTHLETVWSVPRGSGKTISMDRTGRILVSEWVAPNAWITSDGSTKTDVSYERDDDDWESFHYKCLGEDNPGEGVMALPNGDIVFPQGLAVADSPEVYLGLLRRGDSRISKVPVQGLTRADLGQDTNVGWKFCVSPRGHVFVAMPFPKPRLVHITDPSQPECRGSSTVLRGFRVFEEFEAIRADSGHCVYLLVVCNWPSEQEIYLVNPKP